MSGVLAIVNRRWSNRSAMTGHMMGAAGAFEAFATVISVHEQCAPATINYRDPDPVWDVWVVSETTTMPIRYALSNNIGLGGHNGAVIFKRYDGETVRPSGSSPVGSVTGAPEGALPATALPRRPVSHYNSGSPSLRFSLA